MINPIIALKSDIFDGIIGWRRWYILGSQSIRVRYSRSSLGQFWVTLSYFITVLSLGIIYTLLWNTRVEDYLPYLSTSHVFWTLIGGLVIDGCSTFTSNERLLKSDEQPLTLYAFTVLWRNIIVFLHNVIVLFPLYLYFHKSLSASALLVIPGMLLILANGFWMALVAGFICTRFRDMPNIISSFMQIMFFIVPVLWQPSALSHRPDVYYVVAELNPFAALLAVVRDPLLGNVPTVTQYTISLITLVAGLCVSAAIYYWKRNRLAYWL